MPRQPDAEGFKYIVGDEIEILDDYEFDGVSLKANTKAKVLSRTKSKFYDGAPVYQIGVEGEGHYYPVLEEAFKDD